MPTPSDRSGSAAVEVAQRLAGLAIVVLVLGVVLFAGAWVLGGEDAVSDNWVGVTVVVALFTGLFGSFVAMLVAVLTGLRRRSWSRARLAMTTFPVAMLVVTLLEVFVFE